jgi:hypothetical protein
VHVLDRLAGLWSKEAKWTELSAFIKFAIIFLIFDFFIILPLTLLDILVG